jgi:hypothetical protein
MSSLVVLATEGGIPASSWQAKLAVPLGILIFIGTVYLLLRANLGTKRGYLVMATSLWGFMVIYALFWTFGAPGTPPTTGPQNLPGQEADAYLPVWRPFAIDSRIAERAGYDFVGDFPAGARFGEVPADFEETAREGADEIKNFFSGENFNPPPVLPTWEAVDTRYAVADNGYPVIGVTYQETYQPPREGRPPLPEGVEVGEPIPDGRTYTAFAFFDAGSPLFPSLLMLGLVTALFALHALLLARDEARDRRVDEVVDEREAERVNA